MLYLLSAAALDVNVLSSYWGVKEQRCVCYTVLTVLASFESSIIPDFLLYHYFVRRVRSLIS